MRVGLMVIAAVVLATPVQAGALGATFKDFGTCYARQYDDAHLASHPRQQVTAVYLSNTAEPDPNYNGVLLDFGFVTRDGELYSANAYCDDRDSCSLEGDGGTFSVRKGADGLRIDVGETLGLEGRHGFSGDLANSDDRVFLIARQSPRACSYE